MSAPEQPVVGHLAVGPMQVLCLNDAPTPEAVYERLAGRWIAEVWEVTADVPNAACVACGTVLT